MNEKQRAWDEYFMKIAETVALKSKDPSSKMGCVIVDANKRVVSLGYNGMLQVWLLEDGIVAMQTMPDGTNNREYVHNHVLRTPVNGTWGESFLINKDEKKNQHLMQAVDADWDASKLSIVAFVYNGTGVEQVVKAVVK